MGKQNKQFLEGAGYKVEVMWGCDFKKLQDEADYKQYEPEIERHVVPPLKCRDALFGGRTNACKHFAKVINPGDKILYYDVCSLYPWVMKYCSYPVGHPTVILKDFKPIDEYYGLIKCKVLPPTDLYHPLLPAKVDNKLMFPLCFTCAQKRIAKCNHNESQRCFIGTWITEEIQKAVQLGYTILEIYEIWHYDQKSLYNPETKIGGLFSEYISTFQGYKQEASGYPEHVNDEQKKDEFIRKYQQREGVTLRKEKIKYNSGLRSLEKLKLNNLWGKFAQNNNFPKVKYISKASEFYAILNSKALEVTHIDIAAKDRIGLSYKMKEDFVNSSKFTNVIIAAFTTAHARLKLYSYLEKLQRQVLYFDTDSVIFKYSDGMFCPPVGDYLGDLTSELGPGEFITTFCSTGPKSYAYTTNKGNKVCKVKGITLNFRNSLIINEETMYKHSA